VHVGEFVKINQPWIKQAGVRTVIDIGAHNGEFSAAIRVLLPSAQVYAFEPLPDSYEKLRAKFEGDARCRGVSFCSRRTTWAGEVLAQQVLEIIFGTTHG
jgi:predicted RNA methylase